jgi:hypothetical protein
LNPQTATSSPRPTLLTPGCIASLGSVVLGDALAFGMGGRESLVSCSVRPIARGQENQDQVKQDMQLGKGRAHQQAEMAKNKAQDGDTLAAAIRR